MTLQGEIVPRPDSSPAQLKALAAALERWFAACLAELARHDPDVDGWLDPTALDDLWAGELPLPALLRLLGGQPGLKAHDVRDALEAARAAFPLLRKTLPPTEARSVSFGFSLSGSEEERASLLASLRFHLPPGSVAAIIIDGRAISV